MKEKNSSPEDTRPEKKRKLKIQPTSSVLLTPGSSRRKNAWGRLRDSGSNRGMTQGQISDYLESQMKKNYVNVRKDGALTFDKVDKYLEYLARTASQTLVQAEMDRKSVTRFSEETKPLLVDIGSKSSLTDSDVKQHTRLITEKANNQVQGMISSAQTDPSPPAKTEEKPVVPPAPNVAEKPGKPEIAEEDGFLDSEIIPVGFEKGAPRVSVRDFLELPISTKDDGPSDEDWFAAHLKYLEMAARKAFLSKKDLDEVKQQLDQFPKIKYKSHFNIFPDREYEDTQMMIVYSRWRNGTIRQLRKDNGVEED